ncbi:uncharacterized protein LOC130934246 [Arachis stenosperma]|uniref:uncharacterized protein LOC130934246 n=1 Tax=Arachis stenosperma TaxID=217475 RepID=UPI0025AD1F07|nr:uncharacterized protein LOC130934246 [Arachis stenosperma]
MGKSNKSEFPIVDNIPMEDSRGSGRRTWQDYARQRRQNMSEEQRQQHLARRRASYRESIRRGKQIDTSSGPTNMATPLQDITNIPPQQYSISDTHNNTGAGSSNIPNDPNMEIRQIVRASHNCARNFQEDGIIIRTPLPVPRTCHYCSARLFHHETFEMCCNGGKVSLPRVNAPQELLEIFLDPSAEGNHFRKHIRGYNHVFSFTSCGVHIDEQLAITGRGIYTFRLAQRSDVHECSLVIKERPANQPQYSLPTASQVAAIIVGDNVETMIRGRDIKVQTHAGSLRRIQEFIRPDDHSTVLQAGRLLQQYVVDNYVKIETGKLRWVRNRQKKLRAELYQGLQDALHTGETNAGKYCCI